MRGLNVFRFNKETMCEAVEYYLRNKVFQSCQSDISVKNVFWELGTAQPFTVIIDGEPTPAPSRGVKK